MVRTRVGYDTHTRASSEGRVSRGGVGGVGGGRCPSTLKLGAVRGSIHAAPNILKYLSLTSIKFDQQPSDQLVEGVCLLSTTPLTKPQLPHRRRFDDARLPIEARGQRRE